MTTPATQRETLAEVLQQAYQAHQAGDLTTAERGYQYVLQYAPQHAEALHLLGLVAHARGEETLALTCLQQAAAVAPHSWAVYSNLGEVYRSLERLDEAAVCHAQSVQLHPDGGVGHYNLGLVQWAQGQVEAARQSFAHAVTCTPTLWEAWLQLAHISETQGNVAAALRAYESAVQHTPTCAQAYHRLGVLWHTQGQLELATTALQHARRLDPGCAEVHTNLGVVLQTQGWHEAAVACYQTALTLQPACPKTLYNLGTAWQALEELEKACQAYEAALHLDPALAEAQFNLGIIWEQRQEPDRAIAAYQSAIRLHPQHAGAHMNSALIWLGQGKLPQGWEAYEWRWQTAEWILPPLPLPRWDGSAPGDYTVVVQAEQGVGDEIQFAACIPNVLTQARQVMVECDPRLVPLFARSFPTAMVFGRRQDDCQWRHQLPSTAQSLPAGSMPRFYRPTLGHYPLRPAYLLPDQACYEAWRTRLQALGRGLTVGLAWRSLVTTARRNRRYTSLEHWAPLFAMGGIHWVNLQYGECAAELAAVEQQWGIRIHRWDDLDVRNDFDGTAALIAALDLVITPAIAVAQLAAGVGTPVWRISACDQEAVVLGTDVVPDFPTVRMYRQSRPGDWHSVFERMAKDLTTLVSR
jgi:tetratricopeptide (TPR) repeat protein